MRNQDPPANRIEADRRWAALLAAVGGFVDAAGFVILFGLFTAHMSGNSTGLGVALATGDWSEALRRGWVLPVFALATVLGVAWIELRAADGAPPQARTRAVAGVLTLEWILLAVFLGLAVRIGPRGSPVSPPILLATAAAATAAMGFQNAAVRRVQGFAAHTTFVTGMLTELAVSLVRWFAHRRRGEAPQAAGARAAATLAGLIWTAYVAGAFSGAWLVHRAGAWAITLPMAALGAVVAALLLPGSAQGPMEAPGSPPTSIHGR